MRWDRASEGGRADGRGAHAEELARGASVDERLKAFSTR